MVKYKEFRFSCLRCGYEVQMGTLLQSYCPRCSGVLGVEYSKAIFKVVNGEKGLWRYSSLLPPIHSRISLGEGLTPLSRVGNKLFIKNEKYNPTGSYADRASAVIASYVRDLGIEKAVVSYVKDFTRSLTYYLLSAGVNVDVKVDSIFSVELEDIVFFLSRDVGIAKVNAKGLSLEYVNSLTIEGLKTIVFEVYEKRVNVERIVVPAETGLLALSIQKGLRDLQISGCEFNCEVIAAKIKGVDAPLLDGIQGIHVIEVTEDEVYEAYKKLVSKGFKTKPLATLSYYVAELLGNAVAVVTMGFISPSRGRSIVKKHIVEILSKKSPLTAYEIWKEKPIYTLRAIYKAVKDMEAKGELCFDIMTRGKRKIKLYKLC